MPVFRVHLNGKKVCTAGVGERGVLTAIVSWAGRKSETTNSEKSEGIEEELTLQVDGLVSPAEEHLHWLNRDIKIGDEVRIAVLEDATVDQPRHREKQDPVVLLRQQKKYVRAMAKKFGWKIQPR